MDDLMTTDACTLPTVERPLRLAELDALFRDSVVAVERDGLTTRLRMAGSPGLLARVTDLTARESGCCSFFDFGVDGDDAGLSLSIRVPAARRDILDALSDRAAELAG